MISTKLININQIKILRVFGCKKNNNINNKQNSFFIYTETTNSNIKHIINFYHKNKQYIGYPNSLDDAINDYLSLIRHGWIIMNISDMSYIVDFDYDHNTIFGIHDFDEIKYKNLVL